jgi:hypothetical protein
VTFSLKLDASYCSRYTTEGPSPGDSLTSGLVLMECVPSNEHNARVRRQPTTISHKYTQGNRASIIV